MRPLTAVGVGLVLVVLDVALDGIDLVPDPLGWLLAAFGCAALPHSLQGRGPLLAIAVAAALVSVVLWLPAVAGDLSGAEESLLWALDLPQMLFLGALSWFMARAAGEGGDPSARGWWRLVLAGVGVMVVLPPLVYGAGAGTVLVLGVLIGLATVIGAIALCVAHAGRPWVAGPAPETSQGRPS